MAMVAGLQDFRQHGPPADIGTYLLPSSALVFEFTFHGTTLYYSVRSGERGWVLVDVGNAPETVINNTFTTLGAGVRIILADNIFTLVVAGISFSAIEQVLEGQGRGTFIDGDALATGVHAINLSTFDDCEIRNLSVQTEDGGGKTCYCILIEDGADRFHIENVWIINSDSDGIRLEGTNLSGGWILNCKILDSDNTGITSVMDGGNVIENTHIKDCFIHAAYGIHLHNFIIGEVEGNICYNCTTGDGISIFETSYENLVAENVCNTNTTYGIWVLGPRNKLEGNYCMVNGSEGIYLSIPNAHSCIIEGNYCYDNSQSAAGTFHGIRIDTDNCLIIANFCYSPGDSQEDGIHLYDGAVDGLIVGNYCYDGMGSGIALEANNDDCSIVGNYCIANDDYGIEITAATCDRTLVKNNVLNGNVTGQILDNGADTRLPEIFESVKSCDAQIGDHCCVVLTDGISVTVWNQFLVPSEFQELVRAYIFVVPGGTGNMNRSVATDWGKICTENYNADGDAIAAGVVGVTANRIECIDISGALDGIAARDLIGVAYTRNGADANDTVNQDCYYLGMLLQYV